MGVTVETITPGDGTNFPKKGNSVVVHYVGAPGYAGSLTNGVEFDSSRARSEKFAFKIGVGQARWAMRTLATLLSGEADGTARSTDGTLLLPLPAPQVIEAWDEGIMQMSIGQHARLVCTPDYAYGSRGFPPIIPPHATLVFDVELFDIR